MRDVFVDSSVWVDHLRGIDCRETRLLRSFLRRLDPFVVGGDNEAVVDILIGDVVLLEVLRGIDDDLQRHRVRRTLLAFELVRVAGATIPGGLPCFSAGDPRQVLTAAGLRAVQTVGLDGKATLTVWRR